LINEMVARSLKGLGLASDEISQITGVDKVIVDKMLDMYLSDENTRILKETLDSGVRDIETLSQIIANATNTWSKEYFNVNTDMMKEDHRDTLIVAISDLHQPYAINNIGNFLEAMYKDRPERKILVNVGDTFHGDIYSRTKDSQADELFSETYMLTLNLTTKLSTIFDEYYIIKGNHDDFLIRSLMKNKTSLSYSFMMGDILSYIAGGYEFYDKPEQTRDHSNVHYGGTAALKLGNIIFEHPNNYSKYPRKMGEDSATYWQARTNDIGLIVCGHTHRQAEIFTASGILYGECGCMMGRFDHISRKLVTTNSRPNIGYAEMWLDKDLKYVPNSYDNATLDYYMPESQNYFKNLYEPTLVK